MEAAEKYVGEFCDFVNTGGYPPQQVISCDETGVFLKKMPNRNYITKEKNACQETNPRMASLFYHHYLSLFLFFLSFRLIKKSL